MRNAWGTFLQSYDTKAQALEALERMKRFAKTEGVDPNKLHMKMVVLGKNHKGLVSRTWDIYMKG